MFPTDRIVLGPHAYGRRPRTYGVVFHTTEYPSSSLGHGLQCVHDQSPAARVIAWAEGLAEVDDNLVVMGHLNWQTDRSDPGQWFIDLVMSEYASRPRRLQRPSRSANRSWPVRSPPSGRPIRPTCTPISMRWRGTAAPSGTSLPRDAWSLDPGLGASDAG